MPVPTPAKQVTRSRQLATVRLPLLRTDGLARLRDLVGQGLSVRVKPSSWCDDFNATDATVHADAVVLQLEPRWGLPGPRWTLVLTSFGQPLQIPDGRSRIAWM